MIKTILVPTSGSSTDDSVFTTALAGPGPLPRTSVFIMCA